MPGDRIRVCLAAKWFYPAFSGAGMRFQRYAPGLGARGVDLLVFTRTPAGDLAAHYGAAALPRGQALLPVEYVDGLPVQRVRLSHTSPVHQEVEYAQALLNYCQSRATRPDVIHLLSASVFQVPYLIGLRRLGIPTVLSHTLLGELSCRWWKRRLQRLYWRLPFQLVDCVVTASTVGRGALRNLGVTTPIEVIPNGVDLKRFRPLAPADAKRALRERLGLDLEGEVILFLGGLIERKGINVLLQAWATIARRRPQAQLVLVGPTKDDLQQGTQSPGGQDIIGAAINNSGAAERVLLTGRVTNVEDYLQAADLLAFPSRREGMPNAVLEAFACGVATVMTPFLGLSDELGRPGEQYVLVKRKPQALAEAIIALLVHPQRRQHLGQHARRWAERHMDLETTLNRYAGLYRKLLSATNVLK